MSKSRMLTPTPNPTEPSATTSLDRSYENATSALYRAAIGPVNTDYYLPVFARFEAADRASRSWNWAASLCTLNWMAYRQLWTAALAYVAVVGGTALAVFGIGRLLFALSDTAELALLLALLALVFVIPGLYGNAWLHAASRKKMTAALSATTSVPAACAMLTRQASSRRRFIRQALANGTLAAAAVGLYTAFPTAGRLTPSVPQSRALAALAVERSAQPAPNLATLTAAEIPAPQPPAASPAMPAALVLEAAAPLAAASAASAPAAAPAPTQAAAKPPQAVPCTDCLPNTTLAKPQPSASAPGTAPPGTATATAQRFYINVGLFAKDSNARNAHSKLLEAGLAAYTDELKTSKGRRTRVRVGPLQTQSEADAAAEKIRALKLEAAVFQQ